MKMRGVRGATSVTANERDAIVEATQSMLLQMVQVNDINLDDVASLLLTTTTDLTAEYPAVAARQLGWLDMPILCGHEMNVPHGLPLCIRALLHWNSDKTPAQIKHVYLGKAANLRPDRAKTS